MSHLHLDTITSAVANHVLYAYGRGGYPPGSFVSALLAAFDKADTGNFAKLSAAFPEYGYAIHLAAREADGIDKLRALAGAS